MNLPLPGRMRGRDIHEAHRVSTPLELLFDLCFVCAIAAASVQLHHAVVEHHLGNGLLGFAMAMFAIWWAWMNFTWFASAYDTDDAVYRLTTMLQMVGVLILAASIPRLGEGKFAIPILGYVVMRVAQVAHWLRAAHGHPDRATACRRYAIGIALVQLLWVAMLALPPQLRMPWFAMLVLGELAVPMWAERAWGTPWHAHHIAERYGLFTIIVLGECVLGAVNAVGSVLASEGPSLHVFVVGVSTIATVLALWWMYFLVPSGEALHHHRGRSFGWGYGHYVLFASIAATGAFLEVVADSLKNPVTLAHATAAPAAHGVSPTQAIALVAASVALCMFAIWQIHRHLARQRQTLGGLWLLGAGVLAAAVLAVQAGLALPWGLVLVALSPASVVFAYERMRRHRPDMLAVN